jgi:hypothetical protein
MRLPLSEEELGRLYADENPHEVPKLVESIDRLQIYLQSIRNQLRRVKGSRDVAEMRTAILVAIATIDRILPED